VTTEQSAFTVEVVRSTRRKRTVGAQMTGDVLRVSLPSWMSRSEEEKWVETMTRRFSRARDKERIDLQRRARDLARRYDLPLPTEVRWGGDMTTRWGSCTPATGTIRISDRLARMPGWVLDYVLVHELAHLAVPGHSPAFWRLVHRYPKAERAIGYLIAKGGDDPDDDASPDSTERAV
jgi:predicted metal-dependent hydrolase